VTGWIWALVAVCCGLLIGELGGRLVRGARGGPDRSPAVRATARAVGSLVFWTATAIGLVIAVGVLDIDALREMGDTISESLPDLLLAFVMVIIGYAVAIAVSAAVGQSARRASGVRQETLERFLRVLIMVIAVLLALHQVGVADGMIAALVVIVLAVPAVSVALLSSLGGRDVAAQLAAGRALRAQLREGWTLECMSVEGRPVTGRIVRLHPTTVEVETADGARHHVPHGYLLEQPFTVRP
jgi:hypothetical protein